MALNGENGWGMCVYRLYADWIQVVNKLLAASLREYGSQDAERQRSTALWLLVLWYCAY